MKPHCKSSALFVSGIVLCIATLRAFPATVSGGSALTPLSDLEQQAHQRMNTKPRVPLAEATSPIFNGVETGERPGTGLVPNYLRAMALLPKMPAPLAHLFRTIVSGTALPSETKLAMALRIAQVNRSAYTAVHIERLLRTTGRGRLILSDLASNRTDSLSTPERRALEFAEASSKHVDGLGDGEFQGVRAVYNDAQIVELHFVSCFFNYFTRLVEAWRLPVEPWAFESLPTALPEAAAEPARVSLVSDAEMSAVAATDASVRTAGSGGAGLGIALVNSQRAMLRAPAMYEAWRSFGAAASGYDAVSREIKLQVSFAVSTANGCRYCTLHQVLGLRRLGVSPAKLMAMQTMMPCAEYFMKKAPSKS